MLLATDLADYLVNKGVAFRKAHHIVGAVVAFAEKKNKPLNKITLAEFKKIDKHFEKDALKVFNLKTALTARQSTGMPGYAQVRHQIARWKTELELD